MSLDNDVAVENWLKQNNVKTLGLGIIEGGKLKQVKVYGTLKDSVQAPFNAVFNVASLAKTVTAMVTLRLVSLGKWNLDEPVYHYWIDKDVKNDPRHKKLTTQDDIKPSNGIP
jgi:CubicO group peptidase (beta-lactamase class C family)